MTEHFLHDRGLYYRTNAFVAGRPTLVFVHGLSGSSSAWWPYEARFEPYYNLVSFDLRGHGRSRKYPRCRDYAVGHFVDDLTALLDAVGIGTCTIISHSFAVLITLEFLRTHQHRVQALVLVSGTYDAGRSWPAKVLKRILARVDLLERLPFRRPVGTHIDYARFPHSGDWNIRRIIADVRNTTWRVYLFCSKEVYAVHAESLLMDIRVPVLLVHGRHDTIFAVQNSIDMAARIPTADLVVLDADHIVVLNRPREVGAAIERFLRLRAEATT